MWSERIKFDFKFKWFNKKRFSIFLLKELKFWYHKVKSKNDHLFFVRSLDFY